MQRFSWIPALLVLIILAACRPIQPEAADATGAPPTSVPAAAPEAVMLEPQGFIQRVHDPVLAHEGDTYYLFHTGARVVILCSPDLVNWEFCGRVFERLPVWTNAVNRDVGDIWAPDISYFSDRWHLYYAASSMGSQNSAIGLATNGTLDPTSPDYAWEDQGIVLESHVGDQWNAIDPNLVLDESGDPWLVWGSYWEGIFMRKVDAATGMLSESDTTFHHLAQRTAARDGSDSLEGAFVVPHEGKWYLFASFDRCCMGVASTYNVRVGRSDAITGPYVDRDGVPMLEGGGTRILSEYGQWKGPGHNGLLMNDNGVDWIVYHAYDAKQIGISKLRIESIAWDEEGWPSLPSQKAP